MSYDLPLVVLWTLAGPLFGESLFVRCTGNEPVAGAGMNTGNSRRYETVGVVRFSDAVAGKGASAELSARGPPGRMPGLGPVSVEPRGLAASCHNQRCLPDDFLTTSEPQLEPVRASYKSVPATFSLAELALGVPTLTGN